MYSTLHVGLSVFKKEAPSNGDKLQLLNVGVNYYYYYWQGGEILGGCICSNSIVTTTMVVTYSKWHTGVF